MKNLVLCTTILFSVFSCSSDDDLSIVTSRVESDSKSTESLLEVQNISNPFDNTGASFYQNLLIYTSENGFPNSEEQLTAQMFYLSGKATRSSLTNKSVIPITPEMIAAILANPEVKLIELIDDSSLSVTVKDNLIVFVGDLIERQLDDYDQVYSFITSYESDVIIDTALEEDEKDTILKVSSLSRYSLYAEARNRDRDWETSVTNKRLKNFQIDDITIIRLAVLFNSLY